MSDARYEPTPELIEACAAQVAHLPDGVRQAHAVAAAIQHYASGIAAMADGDMRMVDNEGTLTAAWAAVAQRDSRGVVGDGAVCEAGHE